MSNELVDSENTELLIKELAAKAVSGKQTEVWEFLRTLPEERKRFLLVKVRQLLVANSSESDSTGNNSTTPTNGTHHQEEEPEKQEINNKKDDEFGDLDNLGEIDTEIKVEDSPKKEEPKKEPPKQEIKPEPIKIEPKIEPKVAPKVEPKVEPKIEENIPKSIPKEEKGKEEKTEKQVKVDEKTIDQLVSFAIKAKLEDVKKIFAPLSIEEKEYVRQTIKTSLIEADLLQILNGEKKSG